MFQSFESPHIITKCGDYCIILPQFIHNFTSFVVINILNTHFLKLRDLQYGTGIFLHMPGSNTGQKCLSYDYFEVQDIHILDICFSFSFKELDIDVATWSVLVTYGWILPFHTRALQQCHFVLSHILFFYLIALVLYLAFSTFLLLLFSICMLTKTAPILQT